MEVNLSTFGSMQPTEVVEETSTTEAPVTNEVGEISVTDPVVEETKVVEAVAEPIVQTAEAPAEEGTSNFKIEGFEDFEKPSEEKPVVAETKATDWKEIIKKADKREILKELGVDDFAIELAEHIANGGQAVDYLTAKSRDWNNVSDIDVMRDEFKAKYPNLNADEIERKLVRKYMLDDIDDDLKSDGLIDLKSDAYELRQKRIERDKKLVIPQAQQSADPDKVIQDFVAAKTKEREQAVIDNREYFENNNEAKRLMESKRVVVPIGDGGSFVFKVDKPELITKGTYDANFWNKIVSNEKGEPDVAKLQRLVLIGLNEAKYNADLVNYGKTLGHSKEVEEAQNARKPGSSPAMNETGKPTYKVGTYGSMSK